MTKGWHMNKKFTTWIILWMNNPEDTVTFASIDHMARLFILLMIMWFVYYINRIYIRIINSNKEQVMLEKLLNQVSNMFLYMDEETIDHKIMEAIEICGNYFSLENVHLAFLDANKKPDKTYEWYASELDQENCKCTKEKLESLVSFIYPDKIEAEGHLFVSSFSKTPVESSAVDFLQSMGLKSLIVKPLNEKNEIVGILCFGSFQRVLKFGERQRQTLGLITHLISDVWTKSETEKKLYYQAHYDTLTGLLGKAIFLNKLNQAIDKAKESNLLVGILYLDIDEFIIITPQME